MAYCTTGAAFPEGTPADTSVNTIGCRTRQAQTATGLEGDALSEHCEAAGPSGADECGSWCENYCYLALSNCSGENELYSSEGTCETDCLLMPRDGDVGDTSGDTVQCRIYHLGVAGSDGDASAATHCPHGGASGGGVCGEI
jgi:hypothetical protein